MVERKPTTEPLSSPSLGVVIEEVPNLKGFMITEEGMTYVRTIEAFFHALTEHYVAGDWNDIDAADFQDLMEEHGITEKRFPEPGSQEAADWGPDEELHYIKEEFLK